jgi:hypothetical protein
MLAASAFTVKPYKWFCETINKLTHKIAPKKKSAELPSGSSGNGVSEIKYKEVEKKINKLLVGLSVSGAKSLLLRVVSLLEINSVVKELS